MTCHLGEYNPKFDIFSNGVSIASQPSRTWKKEIDYGYSIEVLYEDEEKNSSLIPTKNGTPEEQIIDALCSMIDIREIEKSSVMKYCPFFHHTKNYRYGAPTRIFFKHGKENATHLVVKKPSYDIYTFVDTVGENIDHKNKTIDYEFVSKTICEYLAKQLDTSTWKIYISRHNAVIVERHYIDVTNDFNIILKPQSLIPICPKSEIDGHIMKQFNNIIHNLIDIDAMKKTDAKMWCPVIARAKLYEDGREKIDGTKRLFWNNGDFNTEQFQLSNGVCYKFVCNRCNFGTINYGHTGITFEHVITTVFNYITMETSIPDTWELQLFPDKIVAFRK